MWCREREDCLVGICSFIYRINHAGSGCIVGCYDKHPSQVLVCKLCCCFWPLALVRSCPIRLMEVV